MSTTAEATQDSISRLAGFLRQNPEAIQQTPKALAEQAGVSEEIVRQVMATAGSSARQQPERLKANSESESLRFGQRLRTRFLRWTERPMMFVAATLVAAILISTVVNFAVGTIAGSKSPSDHSLTVSTGSGGAADAKLTTDAEPIEPVNLARSIFQISLYGVVLALHFACYYRWGKARIALIGAGMFWVIITASMVASIIYQSSGQGIAFVLGSSALIGLGFIVLAIMYAGLGVAASVFGGYSRVRKAEASERAMTRQDLLQRLFEIEERLQSGPKTSEGRRYGIADRPFPTLVRRQPFLWALGLSILIGTPHVLLLGVLQVYAGINAEKSIEAAFVSLAFGVVGVLAQFGVSYLAGNVWRAIWVSWVFSLVGSLLAFIPIGPFGPKWVMGLMPWGYVASFAYATVVGLMAGFAARIEERAAKDRLLYNDDPTALLAEMVQIQRKLNPVTNEVCVMVVDAAKSSQMKAEADPLKAEWSFREYQKLIGTVSARFSGQIHSTAGDGAVVAFQCCADAFIAARSLQTEIVQFNHKVNRLKSPFRLRIGLHAGNVAGEIGTVQFSEVIDIAAHAEEKAPIGGIALTVPVASQLSDQRLAKLEDSVDGYGLFLALNPTLDP